MATLEKVQYRGTSNPHRFENSGSCLNRGILTKAEP